MPTLQAPNREDKDTLNPGDRHAEQQLGYDGVNLSQAEKDAFKGIQDNYDSPPGSNDPTKVQPQDTPNININAASAAEAHAAWRTTDLGKRTEKVRTKRRKGPIAAIITILLGGGIGGSFFLSAGLLPFDFRSTMAEKFNSQAKALTERNILLLQKKLSRETTTGLCTTILNVRCRLATMSDRQLKKYEKAGITVNTDGKNYLRTRHKAVSFEFDGRTITAETLRQELKADPNFLSAVRKAYNPILAGYADKIFSNWAQKRSVSKQKNIEGATDEERRESIRKTASGERAAELAANVSKTEECTGGECRDVYRDSNGNEISEEQYNQALENTTEFENQIEESKERASLDDTTGQIAKSTLKGILTSTAFGLNAVDSACSAYVFIRAVSFAAKFAGMIQVMRAGFAVVNSVDAIMAGDGTPGDAEFLGNMLTTTNAAGQSATDSYGYHYAKYGDVSGMPSVANLQEGGYDPETGQISLNDEQVERAALVDETTKYINGQLITGGMMAALLTTLGKASSAEADEFCSFVKSGWGQTIIIGTAVVGAAVAFFTGGGSIGWGLAAQAGVNITIGIAMGMITPKLVETAAGTIITGQENGNRVGNYGTSGMEAFDAQTSQARGLPVLTEEAAVAYKQETEAIIAQNKELERLEVHPLDYTNPNTFLGSIAYNLTPFTSKIKDLPTGITSIAQLTSSTFARIIPSVGAQDSAAEYRICQDTDYKAMGIAVRPFCSPQHGMSNDNLSIDVDTPVNYMQEEHNFATETGEPTDPDNEYAKYIENCMNRDVSIGGYTEDNPSTGEECIEGKAGDNEWKYTMFRLYYIDRSVDPVMDDGYDNTDDGEEEPPLTFYEPSGNTSTQNPLASALTTMWLRRLYL